ncbi:MAG: hypothetical protein LC113_04075 [Acidobacteria bacterium]|nr:hypothetical protein [Acidobacteriota bacterium]
MHGIPGNICLHNGKNISLDELADLMENRFMNWFVHFGSCSTLRSYAAAERFASRTGAKMVSGFTKDVNWVESAAFELLLFELLQERQSAKIIARQVWSRYGELAERNGFICFPEHLRPGQA